MPRLLVEDVKKMTGMDIKSKGDREMIKMAKDIQKMVERRVKNLEKKGLKLNNISYLVLTESGYRKNKNIDVMRRYDRINYIKDMQKFLKDDKSTVTGFKKWIKGIKKDGAYKDLDLTNIWGIFHQVSRFRPELVAQYGSNAIKEGIEHYFTRTNISKKEIEKGFTDYIKKNYKRKTTMFKTSFRDIY